MNETYEAPTLAEIGTLHELTMQTKTLFASDGTLLQIGPVTVPIGS